MSAGKVTRRAALGRIAALGSAAAAMAACGATPAPPAAEATVAGSETAAVAPEVTAPPATGTEITLSVMQWGSVLGDHELLVSGAFERFKAKNPGIVPTLDSSPWATYWTKINTLAAAGTMPDLYSQSLAYSWDHANTGLAMNLQPFFERDLDFDKYFMEVDFSCCRYPSLENGDWYSFPPNWVGAALFYNKNILDEAGVAYPDETWTYDDLLSTAKVLTKVEGDQTVQWGTEAAYADSGHPLITLVHSYGGRLISEDYRKCMLTQPEALEAVQWAVDAVHKDKVAISPTASKGFPEGAFASGVIGMSVRATYNAYAWKDAEFGWDTTYAPKGPVRRAVSTGPGLLAIGRTTKEAEAAWRLFAHWIGEEEQTLLDVVLPGGVPILKSAAHSDAWIKREGHHMDLLLDTEAYTYASQYGGPSWMEWNNALNSEFESVYLEEKPVEEAMQAACAAIDGVLAGIKWPK
ncbi:MAG: ABC transporter substrate-binding protein [Anaerolineae bacterium]